MDLFFSHRRTAHRIFNSSKQSSGCSNSRIRNLITIGQILEAFVARSRKLIARSMHQGNVLNTKLIDSATRSDLGLLSPSVTLKYPKALAKIAKAQMIILYLCFRLRRIWRSWHSMSWKFDELGAAIFFTRHTHLSSTPLLPNFSAHDCISFGHFLSLSLSLTLFYSLSLTLSLFHNSEMGSSSSSEAQAQKLAVITLYAT